MTPRTLVLAAVTTLALTACSGGGEAGATAAADTLTRRQKDSLVSTMPIPGARGVGRALDAADAARERARAHDTIR